MSTRFLTAGELSAMDKWYVIDARTGTWTRRNESRNHFNWKARPQYAPFLVSGDHVIIVNADKIKLTGEKLDKKVYRWHTLYPGGLREVGARKVFETKPEQADSGSGSGHASQEQASQAHGEAIEDLSLRISIRTRRSSRKR